MMRVSWSILNAWARGDRDNACRMLAGIETEKTPAMERGIRLHRTIAENKMKLIPIISKNAVFEGVNDYSGVRINYYRVALNDWLYLSLVVDVLDEDNNLIIDWKASRKKSTEHSKMQIYLYALALSKLPVPKKIKYGVYATVKENGKIYCDDYSIFKINNKKLDLAYNYAITIAGEIKEALGL